MRAFIVLCLMAVFRLISMATLAPIHNYQSDYKIEEKKDIPRRPLSELEGNLDVARDKRADNEDPVASPTRHAKHRRRRRCRNRVACSRPVASTKQRAIQGKRASIQDVDEARLPRTTESTIPKIFIDEEHEDDQLYEENDFEDISSWSRIDDSQVLFPSFYAPIDDPIAIHESLGTLITRLFQILRNASLANSQDLLKQLNFVDTANEDPCQKWLNSKDKLEEAFLGPFVTLPACPCQYPSTIFYDDKIWDEKQQKHFRWRDVSGESQRLDVYKPGASYCVRSLLAKGSGSAAAQHCCYDRNRKLLTRGSGAGTPNFVSPEISVVLHEKIDILPWRLCKGDFSRFNKVRPPNNGNNCDANPDNEEYQRQINDTKYY